MEIHNCTECFFKEIKWDENPCFKCGGWKDGSKEITEHKIKKYNINEELKNKRDNEKKIFGDNLRAIREKNKLKRVFLARAIGVTPASVGRYENGIKLPMPMTIKKICEFLDIDLSLLLNLPEKRTVGDNIRYYRIKNGLETNELGEIIGWKKGGGTSCYEIGKAFPKETTLIKLADALSITVDQLMEGVEK